MKEKFEELMMYLSENYRPQSIEEISENLGIEIDKLKIMADFLAKYDFIQYNYKELKIDPQLRELYLYDKTVTTATYM